MASTEKYDFLLGTIQRVSLTDTAAAWNATERAIDSLCREANRKGWLAAVRAFRLLSDDPRAPLSDDQRDGIVTATDIIEAQAE